MGVLIRSQTIRPDIPCIGSSALLQRRVHGGHIGLQHIPPYGELVTSAAAVCIVSQVIAELQTKHSALTCKLN